MPVWNAYLNNEQTKKLLAYGKELHRKRKIATPTRYQITRHILLKTINANKE